jgi:hypothetical protein
LNREIKPIKVDDHKKNWPYNFSKRRFLRMALCTDDLIFFTRVTDKRDPTKEAGENPEHKDPNPCNSSNGLFSVRLCQLIADWAKSSGKLRLFLLRRVRVLRLVWVAGFHSHPVIRLRVYLWIQVAIGVVLHAIFYQCGQ